MPSSDKAVSGVTAESPEERENLKTFTRLFFRANSSEGHKVLKMTKVQDSEITLPGPTLRKQFPFVNNYVSGLPMVESFWIWET